MVTARRGELHPELPAAMRRLRRLNGVLPARVIEWVEHASGLTEPQLCKLLDVRYGMLADAVAQLNQGEDQQLVADALARFNVDMDKAQAGVRDKIRIEDYMAEANRGQLLVRVPVYKGPDGELTSNVRRFDGLALPNPEFHMHYGSREAAIIISHRDVSSLNRSRHRFHEDIRKDHNVARPQLLHTLQLNDCYIALHKANYNVSAGYRGCLYLPGGQQLVPDARLSAHLDLGEFPTEFLSGNWFSPTSQRARDVREGVRQQLVKYVPDARDYGSLIVACLCENELLMEVAREEVAEIAQTHQVTLSALPLLQRHFTVDPPRPGKPEVLRRILMPIGFYLEYERSATTRGEIRKKLMPYFRVARRGHSLSVIFICETPTAAELFREVRRNLEEELEVSIFLITSTYAEVTAGEFDSCWNRNGTAIRLS